jgi:SAM-dependent methyltransferase
MRRCDEASLMSTTRYKEFEWHGSGAGNGEAGVGLTQKFIDIVTDLEDVERVCDLGCGNGFMAGRLAELGYDVTGIDASESGIAIARLNFSKARFLQASIDASLGQSEALNEFDVIVSSDVIEHLYRPADLIEAAGSMLKPNGYLVIGTPYHGYLKNLALSLTGKMDSHFASLDDGGHIKFFSVKTLSELLTRYGFIDLKFEYYGRAQWLWMNMICQARKN